MIIIVQPQRADYRLIFSDGRHVRAVGVVVLAETPKGIRPKDYRLRRAGSREYRNTPSKELVALLRSSTVHMTRDDQAFGSFLEDIQVKWTRVHCCRLCLLEDKVTPIDQGQAVKYGRELICLPCARREMRRELTHLNHMGRGALGHLDDLLARYRDLDRVIATLLPDKKQGKQTLFDRIEAQPVQVTTRIEELPLPRAFVDVAQVESLMPAQQLAVEAGLLFGKDLLVVSATASGKTFIGEMAGLKNYLEGRGRILFLVPLVALATQKYRRFSERYRDIAQTSLQIGQSRIHLRETKVDAVSDPRSPILVGTYEGVDHQIRLGRNLGDIGTVVIDEVQMLEDPDRGHRLDGLIARLKYQAPNAQFLYLSATIGSPKVLAKKLNADLVRYADRPVALDRHLMFVEKKEKIPAIKRLIEEEYKKISSKGYHGQSIVFTNSRARCHLIADKVGKHVAAYHAGLTAQERREVEDRFTRGKLAGVITTAALGAGVDFPASQVVFDALAMGISWLSVQEFSQMSGRAGRPDFHDQGRVVILAEPGATYSREAQGTEEEVALRLLKGEMEEVAPEYDIEESSEEFVANAIVCRGDPDALVRIEGTMVGSTEPVLDMMLHHHLVKREGGRIQLTDLSRVMASHFIGVERLLAILRLVEKMDDPIEILTELHCEEE
jgi:archaea-specific helicase